jgi:uncharacterized protein (DUF305 family)
MRTYRRSGRAAVTAALLAAVCGSASAQETAPPPVQPGAPGQPGRVLDPDRAAERASAPHTRADVRFMQGMIEHHAQALEMTRLVPSRTTREDIRRLALRIELSQLDEIEMMHRWLTSRGEESPGGPILEAERGGAPAHPGHHHGHAGHGAPPGGGDVTAPPHHGMLTPEEMQRLAAASGAEFDRLFLRYMIRHHDGAVIMVEELFAAPGGGQESEIFEIASHVDADQRIELERMRTLAAGL